MYIEHMSSCVVQIIVRVLWQAFFDRKLKFTSCIWLLQAWQVPHPPKRGSGFCNDRPAVHKGFLQSYTANGFNQRIVDRVAEIVATHEWPCTKVCGSFCSS
jgi:hypothetical protein